MRRKKTILILGLLLFAGPLSRAQEVAVQLEEDAPSPWIVRMAKKGFRLLTSPNRNLDSAFVYQLPLRWSAGAENTNISVLADLHSDVTESALTGQGGETSYGMDFHLQNHLYHKVGANFGYGGLSAGYGFEVGGKSKERNTYFSLGLSANAYGVQVQNYVIREYIEKSGGPSDVSARSAYPGRLQDFAVDAFYVFDGRRFVYGAAYKGAKVQRHSVGSWMLSGRYLQGDLTVDDRDTEFLEITDRLGRYATRQVALGGGYSFNWVLFHRDPADWDKAMGLRNLTLNLTALPMASFYTHVDSYSHPTGGNPVRTRFDDRLALALQAHSALCLNWDRFSLNVQGHYNRFGFNGAAQTLRSSERGLRYDVATRAFFQDFNAKLQFFVRF